MLRVIEYTLLAVSLLVVVGLIVSGSRSGSDGSPTEPPALGDKSSEAPNGNKPA